MRYALIDHYHYLCLAGLSQACGSTALC